MSVTVTEKGLSELGRELGRIDSQLDRALPRAHKKVTDRIVSQGRPAIAGLPSPGGSKATSGLSARVDKNAGTILLDPSNPTLYATVFGTRSHMVYGNRIPGSGPWSRWLGMSVEPEQLYGLGKVVANTTDHYADEVYADAYMDGLSKAFPH